MTESKTLQTLWDENGQKPFQANASSEDRSDNTWHYILGKNILQPHKWHGHNNQGLACTYFDKKEWHLVIEPKPKKKLYRALCRNDKLFFVSLCLFESEEKAKDHELKNFIRILTEKDGFPAIEVDCD